MGETNKAGVCCSVFFVFMGVVGIITAFDSYDPHYGFIILMFAIGSFGLVYYYGMDYVEFRSKNFGDFSTRVAGRWNRNGWSESPKIDGLEFEDCRTKEFKSSFVKKGKKCYVASMPLGNNRMRQTFNVMDVTFTFKVFEFVFDSEEKRKEHDERIKTHFAGHFYRRDYFAQDNVYIVYAQSISPICPEAEHDLYSYELEKAVEYTKIRK
ncbi:MAG: hypothetical protein IJF83_11550 [Methanobrevibacter sp.]|nr:hypothetical protein [Methanobrevibacter sp.]